MTNETLSILDLQDVVLPPAVGLWPFAPLVWVLLGGVLIATIILIVRRVQRWRRNRYRRAGLELLASSQDRFKGSGNASELVADLSALLKRVALAAFPREQVASLYGHDWLRFLENTHGGTAIDSELGDALTDAVCAGSAAEPLSAEQCERLIDFSSHWIRKHQVSSQEDG